MTRRPAVVLAALALALAPAACGPCDRPAGSGGPGGGPVRDGRSAIAGTAVDARNGDVLGGVRIEGPDGARTVSRPDGRFALELAPGTRGRLVGTLEDGRRAERAVGPLAEGQRLEIVLRLARPPR